MIGCRGGVANLELPNIQLTRRKEVGAAGLSRRGAPIAHAELPPPKASNIPLVHSANRFGGV